MTWVGSINVWVEVVLIYDEIQQLFGRNSKKTLHGDLKMNKNYYIKQIRDLSKNYDSDAQSKYLMNLQTNFLMLMVSKNCMTF